MKLQNLLNAGEYKVEWHAVSVDMHKSGALALCRFLHFVVVLMLFGAWLFRQGRRFSGLGYGLVGGRLALALFKRLRINDCEQRLAPLKCSVMLEWLLGIGAVAAVSVLGTLPPMIAA